MKINLLLLIALILLTSLLVKSSELNYYQSLGGYEIGTLQQMKIFNSDIYFLDENGFHIANENMHKELYSEELNEYKYFKNSKVFYCEIFQPDLIAFTYGGYYTGNGLIIKDGDNWYGIDSSNSEIDDASIFDFVEGPDREIAVINVTNKLGFYKNGIYENYDCEMDFECMPTPFVRDRAVFYNNCYYYQNSKSNISLNCNKEFTKTISYKELNVNDKLDAGLVNWIKHNNEIWFCNNYLNQVSIIDGDDITTFSPLSEEDNIKYRLDPEAPLLIYSLLWGNDGKLYLLYKQAADNGHSGVVSPSVVFKMDKDYNVLEVLDIPQIIKESPPIIRLLRDESDSSNMKVYIPTSNGLYIYDPTTTSVDDKTEDGPGALFVTQVYPNPANTFINVRYGADISNYKNIEVYVTNILGQRIKTFEDSGHYSETNGYGSAVYDISDLPTGQYLLVLTDGNSFATESIIIQR